MKKRLFSLMLALIMVFAAIPTVSAAFADVPENAWYAENVAKAYELGLVKGVSETEFNPEGKITLAETIALACRLHSSYYGNDRAFEQGNVWYEVYVDYAAENGITEKYTSTDYNAAATRLQFAEVFAAALPKNALRAINDIRPGQIPDVTRNEAVYLLYNAGVLTGSDENGTFLPDTTIRRCEVAAIVTRMADESLRQRFALADKEDKKEPSAWDEYTEDDVINFRTLTTIFKGTKSAVNKADSHLSKLDNDKLGYSSIVLCQDYLAMCYEHFDVLTLACEDYDYLEEVEDLATLAMDVIEPFLDLPLPEPYVNYSYYIEEYMSCVDSVASITDHLEDAISDLSSMF